ncbi:MAG: Rv3654c family TadE-like protein [Pseudoclavibacter sp.]
MNIVGPGGRCRRRCRRVCHSEAGSGTAFGALALAGCAFLLATVMGLAGAVIAHGAAQRVADQAAVAAADTRLGLHPGTPCVRGEQLAAAHGVQLAECALADDGSVRVRIERHVGVFVVTGRARAGPR